MLALSSEKRQREKLPYERKANLKAQTLLPTSIKTNFHFHSIIFIRSLTHISPERALIHIYLCNFNSIGHQSTDIQFYNEWYSKKQNVIAGNSKKTRAFLYFF